MKLIGSMLEDDIRKGLIGSRQLIFGEKPFEDERFIHLLRKIKEHFPFVKTAYLLAWTPDQGEDFFTVLIDSAVIFEIELDRFDSNVTPIVTIEKVANYTRRLKKKQEKITLFIAMDLSCNDLKRLNM